MVEVGSFDDPGESFWVDKFAAHGFGGGGVGGGDVGEDWFAVLGDGFVGILEDKFPFVPVWGAWVCPAG